MNNANEQLSLGPSCGQIEMNDFGPTKIWKIYYLTRNRRMIIRGFDRVRRAWALPAVVGYANLIRAL